MTIAQKGTHVILTLRASILTPSTRVTVTRASKETVSIVLVSLTKKKNNKKPY